MDNSVASLTDELVSVVIPTYNRANTIYDAVMSVVNQTYKNLEIIIWDDGSTDNTKEIIDSINDDRIRYFYGENGGAGYARNMGIKVATGKYIAFHDSDDICRINRIESQLSFLRKTNSDMVYAQLERHLFEDKNKVFVFPEDGEIGKTIEETYRNFITRSSVWTQVVFCKACCCKEILFNESLPAMEDWEWSLRFAKKYKINWKKEVIVDSFISENSISRSSHNKMITLEAMYDIYRDDIEKYKIQPVWRYLIAYYRYNDHPETHFDYGLKKIQYGVMKKSFYIIFNGILYMIYIKPFRSIVRRIRKRGYHGK